MTPRKLLPLMTKSPLLKSSVLVPPSKPPPACVAAVLPPNAGVALTVKVPAAVLGDTTDPNGVVIFNRRLESEAESSRFAFGNELAAIEN